MLNVTRHPYSFIGDNRTEGGSLQGFGTPEGQEKTWHESLLGYCGGSESVRREAEETMRQLGRRAGIELDYGVQTNWQPVDSQRLMLWAGRFGKQEKYMSALARLHFEECTSASHRATLLRAAEASGLDVDAARAFLDTDELRAEVWRSYGETIHEKGIHAIPYFVFNSPLTDGGPFRSGNGKPVIINGSGDEQVFLDVFEQFLRDVEKKGCL
mmetsp:Transcript_85333/g.198394  ORF Transcript_85333/g.198394 Transcript_85333/m.198394 type:complete len:213 (-) Transcript_85333:162-800(-)